MRCSRSRTLDGPGTDAIAAARRAGSAVLRAFSLVELLVAIAVIAVLIGILVPSLGGALRTSKDVACLSNLKQVSLGWNMYMDENADAFPRAGSFDWGGVDWYDVDPGDEDNTPNSIVSPNRPVNPYIGVDLRHRARMEVFQCPRDTGFKYMVTEANVNYTFSPESAAEDLGQTIYAQLGTSYRANEWIWMLPGKVGMQVNAPNYNRTNRNTRNMVAEPSRLILVGDCGPFVAGRWTREARIAARVAYSWWHGEERCNFAFLDGSARGYLMTPGTAATTDYHFYLNPYIQPRTSWAYASVPAGTRPAPSHDYAE